MNKINLKAEIQNLKKLLKKYSYSYHTKNISLVTDAEYDQLFSRLVELEGSHPEFSTKMSPTKTIGAPVSKNLKYKHKTPMLSLKNCYDKAGLYLFINKIEKNIFSNNIEIVAEHKIDGVAFNAFYKEGTLRSVATRGNGSFGEIITKQVENILNFPNQIETKSKSLEVRGEIYIKKDSFKKVNSLQKALGQSEFKNRRNFVTGTLRQSNYSAYTENLSYFAYGIGFSTEIIGDTQKDILIYLKDAGFCICEKFLVSSDKKKLISFFYKQLNKRAELEYDIDGIVFKVNNLGFQASIGESARVPNYAVAYKFTGLLGETKLLNVVTQIGRTGVITPVAILKDINIGGVNITKATLHNYDAIADLDLRIGDTIVLERAGDVIPKINAVNYNKRNIYSSKIQPPIHCPSCSARLIKKGKLIYCDNRFFCSAQREKAILHLVSANAFNIPNLGEKTIRLFISEKIIINTLDVFYLYNKINFILNLPGWNTKSTDKLLYLIEKSKKITLANFIYSLNIKGLGIVKSELLSREFKTKDKLLDTFINISKMDTIPGSSRLISIIGKSSFGELFYFCKIDQNINFFQNLMDLVEIISPMSKAGEGLPSKIVFTGRFKSFTRNEAKKIAETIGLQVTDTISRNVKFVVVGVLNPGAKLEKAKNLNIQTFREEDWLLYTKNKLKTIKDK